MHFTWDAVRGCPVRRTCPDSPLPSSPMLVSDSPVPRPWPWTLPPPGGPPPPSFPLWAPSPGPPARHPAGSGPPLCLGPGRVRRLRQPEAASGNSSLGLGRGRRSVWAPAAPATPSSVLPRASRPGPVLRLGRDAGRRLFPLFGPRCNQILTVELLP